VRAGGRAKNQQQTTFEVAVAETARGPLALVMYGSEAAALLWLCPDHH
jgi:hypothetical protein